MGYTPTKDVAQILKWARSEIEAVPYEVTTRWVFYQVYQQYGVPKELYRKFLKWTSRARKGFWDGWSPTTLADDTREIADRGGGYDDADEWVESFLDDECLLSTEMRQRNIVLVLFEAAAMRRQFDYYLAPLRVATAPFQGDASIRHKWEIAKRLERLHEKFPDKPIRVLYFGDLDPKGEEIPVNALRDIWSWFEADDIEGDTLHATANLEGTQVWRTSDGKFEWRRVGLNRPQIPRLRIRENPEKPGTYQWEALNDEQARTMILDAVRTVWDAGVIAAIESEENATTARFREDLRRAVARWHRQGRGRRA